MEHILLSNQLKISLCYTKVTVKKAVKKAVKEAVNKAVKDRDIYVTPSETPVQC